MRRIAKDRCEIWAEHVWRQYAVRAPLDVPALCRQLGIRYHEIPAEPEFSGCRLPVTHDLTLIFVNRLHPPTRKRFTGAHEIAHHLLGHAAVTLVSLRAYLQDSTQEREANYLAGCLVAPASHVRRAVAQHGPEVDKLARHFGISRHAMQVRLEQLGYPLDPWQTV